MGNGLFQANAEGAPLRSYYNLALARQPPDGPSENGAFALHQLLEPRERKLAVGIEGVPNSTRHLPYVFLDRKSHPSYIISILRRDDCRWRHFVGLGPLCSTGYNSPRDPV